jgi:hypothetical protein
VVYSTERPGPVKLVPLDESMVQDSSELGALPSFRARILPVLGTIPAMFGNAMATFVITSLANFATTPLPSKSTRRQAEKLLKDFIEGEKQQFGEQFDLFLNVYDVITIFEDVWNGRSGISGTVNQKLTLTRWVRDKPASMDNIVLMTKSEREAHLNLNTDQFINNYGENVVEFVENRLSKAKEWSTQ